MRNIKNILYIWYYEVTNVMHDNGMLIFVIITPLLYPLLYAYVYTNEVVREVPIVVVDEPNCAVSRDFIRKTDATPDISVYATCHSMTEAEEFLKRQEAYGIMRIPSSFDKDLWHGRQTNIGLYCDMSSTLYYKALMIAVNNVTQEVNRKIKIEYMHCTTERQEEIARMPIEYDYVTLYNPQGGYAAFLIPPVFMLIIHQLLLLGIGMSTGNTRERWHGSIIPFHLDYKNAFNIVIGKTIFYFMLFFLWGIYMFSAVTPCFSLPQLGNYVTFLAFLAPYLLACISFALVFSALIYRREDCILLFIFMSVPLLFLSGVSWPGVAIPQFWKYVSWLFPSTFGMNGYLRIQNMGVSLRDLSFEYYGLWIQAGTYFLLAVLLYRWQIQRLLKKISE